MKTLPGRGNASFPSCSASTSWDGSGHLFRAWNTGPSISRAHGPNGSGRFPKEWARGWSGPGNCPNSSRTVPSCSGSPSTSSHRNSPIREKSSGCFIFVPTSSKCRIPWQISSDPQSGRGMPWPREIPVQLHCAWADLRTESGNGSAGSSRMRPNSIGECPEKYDSDIVSQDGSEMSRSTGSDPWDESSGKPPAGFPALSADWGCCGHPERNYGNDPACLFRNPVPTFFRPLPECKYQFTKRRSQ